MLTIILKKCTKELRSTRISSKECVQIVGGDFNAELGPSCGVERASVGTHTLNERKNWMRQWPVLENFTALNTMY